MDARFGISAMRHGRRLMRPFRVAGPTLIVVVAFSLGSSIVAADEQLACDRSPVVLAIPDVELSCSRAVTTENEVSALRAADSPEVEALMVLATAFVPLNAETYVVEFAGNFGKHGTVNLAVARPGHALSAPLLRNAVEAEAKLGPFSDDPATITWRSAATIQGYDVEFYKREYPVIFFGGGPRECMIFVRYLDGTAASHTRHVAGYYCDTLAEPLTTEIARSVLASIELRPQLIE